MSTSPSVTTSASTASTSAGTSAGLSNRAAVADSASPTESTTQQNRIEARSAAVVPSVDDKLSSLYNSLGATSSYLGSPTSDSQNVASGLVQTFQNGAIYWSESTGAHAVHGAILGEYQSLGGPTGVLGWPTTDEMGIAGGTYQKFTGGQIYWTAGQSAHVVRGAVLSEYFGTTGPLGILGFPTSDEAAVNGGTYQNFQNGRIYWTAGQNAHNVHGQVLSDYLAQNGPSGTLGFPTSDENSINGGTFQNFRGGQIHWSPSTGAHATHGSIGTIWGASGWEAGPLGWPTSDEVSTINGGTYQNFQGGAILWSPSTGARITRGAIRAEWLFTGAERGVLGFPTSNEVSTINGGTYQNFQNGQIYWAPGGSAHEVHGAVNGAYNAQGGPAGTLGFPISDENSVSGGTFQNFRGGQIHWSSSTGAHITRGAIGAAWGASGWQTGPLGWPTSDEVSTINGGTYQNFQGGAILWSPSTGAHITRGAIRTEWLSAGTERGYLGFPTSDEVGTVNGGTYQNYQGGAILWSPSTGAHAVHGAIRNEWMSQGYEAGHLGFPTSDENCLNGSGCYQFFQGGTISWTASGGAVVSSSNQSAAAKILSDNGFDNADAIVQAARDTGLPLGIAVALIAKESYGANVYGHDSGGALSGWGTVTQDNFTNQFMPLIRAGNTSNGVGPTQITYSGYFLDNPTLAWWDPYTNMSFGFNILKGYLNGDYSDASIIAAGSTYNSGSATGAPYYGQSFDQLAINWTNLLAGS